MSGKAKPVPGQKLKAENVSWDVTSNLNASSSDSLPLVFQTGYRIHYVPNGVADPLIKPFPKFGSGTHLRTWLQALTMRQGEVLYYDSGGLAVTYKNNSTLFKSPGTSLETQRIVPDFISKDFVPDGQIHHQLTPNAMLP